MIKRRGGKDLFQIGGFEAEFRRWSSVQQTLPFLRGFGPMELPDLRLANMGLSFFEVPLFGGMKGTPKGN